MPTLIERFDNTPEAYHQWRQKRCLLGALVGNIHRELIDLDRYVSGQLDENNTFQETSWDVGAHVYERLIDPFFYRMKPRYFFSPYLGKDATNQFAGGCLSGPVIGGSVLALAVTAGLGLCSPWWGVGLCCLPSLAYLIQGIKSFGTAVCILNSNQDARHLRAKQAFLRGSSCLLIACMLPVAFALMAPIELVRFFTRLVATAIEAVKPCILRSTPEHVNEGFVFS